MTQARFRLGNASLYGVSLIKDPPRRISRIFALFDPFEAKFELVQEVNSDAEYYFTHYVFFYLQFWIVKYF